MTVVLDASVLVELLIFSPLGQRAASQLHDSGAELHVPHLADIETVSVLRGLVLGGHLTAERAGHALTDLRDFPAKRWPAAVLLERVWELRQNVTTYDATYVALAELMDAEFVTVDAKLARALDGIAECEVTLVR